MNRAHRATRRLAWMTLLVLSVSSLAGCGSETSAAGKRPASAVTAVQDRPDGPSLSGTTIAGEQFDPSRVAGDVTVVNFWASWCGECRSEMPELIAASQTHAAAGVQLVGVNIRDSHSQADGFADDLGIPFPSLFDPDNKTLISVQGMLPHSPPSTIVLDRQGRIAGRFVGSKPAARRTR